MATRPVFISQTEGDALVRTMSVEFVWHAGMARSQRQRSVASLHEAIRFALPEAHILEVSSMSQNPVGEKLSAFNLTFRTRGRGRDIAVECAFQASKVFEHGGPYTDLLEALPLDAKRDPRLQTSGRLLSFRFFDQAWPLEPLTAFYDWVYINALHQQTDLADAAMSYDAFTDIAFNPEKSVNCQAGSVALYVALRRRSLLEEALKSRESFLGVLSGGEVSAWVDDDPQGRLL